MKIEIDPERPVDIINGRTRMLGWLHSSLWRQQVLKPQQVKDVNYQPSSDDFDDVDKNNRRVAVAHRLSLHGLVLVALLVVMPLQANAAESFNLIGSWHEDEKCQSPGFQFDGKGDPWEVGNFLTTPQPEGNIINGVGPLAITRYEFGCTLQNPKLGLRNRIVFQATCSGENSRPRKGEVSFIFIAPKTLNVTFPFVLFDDMGRPKSNHVSLYKCAS